MTLTTARADSERTEAGFDAFLGAAQNRYLGEGHRRVGLHLTQPVVLDASAFASSARLTYPLDWSMKAGIPRAPHLSTVDAIRVSGEMTALLTRSTQPWLAKYDYQRRLTVRAGARPWETLRDVPVRSVVTRSPNDESVQLEHMIGSLKVSAFWTRSGGASPIDEDWAAGSASNIQLSSGSNTGATAASVTCAYRRVTTEPTLMSFLEAMMLTAQMSQVALYEGDAAARDRSGNMWMRRAAFERLQNRADSHAAVGLRLENRRQLVVGERRVGTADVVAEDVFGVHVTASLAIGS